MINWIPVSDSLPAYGRMVVAWGRDADGEHTIYKAYRASTNRNGEKWNMARRWTALLFDVTHWAEMPNAPVTDQQTEPK